MIKLDKYDEKLLYELSKNSRLPASSIAKKIRLTPEAVLYRIKKLKQMNYIQTFLTIINASHIGYRYVWFMVKFSNSKKIVQQKALDFLLTQNYISNIRVLEGNFDLAALIIYQSNDELYTYINALMNKFEKNISEKKFHEVMRSYKFNLSKPRSKTENLEFTSHKDVQKTEISALDKKILKVISSNARISVLEIAKKINADPSTIRYRLKNLEKKNIIEGYGIILNLEKTRSEYHKINISLKKYDSIKKILAFFDKQNCVTTAYQLLGDYDLSIDIFVKDSYELRQMLIEFREEFSESYLNYDLLHIVSEHRVNWSPFD